MDTYKKLLLALLVGIAFGYHWGYDQGSNGEASIASRTLDQFGASRVRAAQAANQQRIDDAGQP